jgi:isoleucyl-tRNA synthetase
LAGGSYKPLFDYFSKNDGLKNHENGWKVYAADFVTTEAGTGIVHIAPAFGEDDFRLSKAENLPFVQHVGMDGVFTKEVTDFPGLHVKPIDDIQSTDVAIVKYLAAQGTLFSKEKHEHSYPHCWRCDTPLLNYATSSWFVAVTKIKPQLLEYAKDINWSPEHIKEGRWGQWLLGARDWSISRQRFWATTIPLWKCADCKMERVFGSIAELKEVSGVEVADLHKDVVDEVTFACKCGGVMRRIPDVLDTWFDSGSVPYAALHYPFENEAEFKARMPVDFIAEGQDQTRTWFYYQHVLAGALFKSRAFDNVIVNGLVMAEDGKKMSKKLSNYPDPLKVVDAYGADALRLYLLSSPVVAADNLSFREAGVDELMKKVIMRLENVYSFAALYEKDGPIESNDSSTNVLDRWMIARTRETMREVTAGMDAYQLDTATRPLFRFVDDLSTWYLRRSRDRFKGADAAAARATLRFVLRMTALMFAPSAPFMADSLWTRLPMDGDAESVHLARWPEDLLNKSERSDEQVLLDMGEVRAIVERGHEARARSTIAVRQPLAKASVIAFRKLSGELEKIIIDELNVESIEWIAEGDSGSVVLDTVITPELKEKGAVRDLLRLIQDARKSKGLEQHESATLMIATDPDTAALIERNKEQVMRATKLVSLGFGTVEGEAGKLGERAITLRVSRT